MYEKVVYQYDEAKGRTLCAYVPMAKGELICFAPATPIDADTRWVIGDTELGRQSFANPDGYDPRHDEKAGGYDVKGPPAYCSHADKPNAHVEFVENQAGALCYLYADEDLSIGQEITIRYLDLESGRYPDHEQWRC